LYGCHIGDHGINILHKYISGNKLIKQEIIRLDISKCGLSEASSSAIGDIIIQLEPRILKLNNNSIVRLWDISAAVVSSVAVKELAIAENNLTSEVANELSNMMYHLVKLDISSNKLDEHAAVVLSEAIKKTKTLIILNINNNKIKATGATVFADSLEYNTSLKVLYMNSNDIGQDGATGMAKAIAGNNTLQWLDISNNYVGCDGAVALSEAITASNSLEALDISDNGIKFKGIEAVAKSVTGNTSLKLLHINNTPICHDGAVAIAKAVTKNQTLQVLALGGNNTIDEESAITIAESLYNNTSITFLGLLMPFASTLRGSELQTEFDRIHNRIEKIKTNIAKIRNKYNEKSVEINLMGCRTFL